MLFRSADGPGWLDWWLEDGTESAIEIEFRSQKPGGDRERRRATSFVRTGTADPFGEIEIWVGKIPRMGTVTADGLPLVEVQHPDTQTQGYLSLDSEAVLTVGGTPARFSFGSGLRKADRALGIGLGERTYTLRATERGTEELRNGRGNPLVTISTRLGPKPITVKVAADADPTDLALALAFLVLDTQKLTITRTVVIGGWTKLFNSGGGEAG